MKELPLSTHTRENQGRAFLTPPYYIFAHVKKDGKTIKIK
jgi:hypothetical protein